LWGGGGGGVTHRRPGRKREGKRENGTDTNVPQRMTHLVFSDHKKFRIKQREERKEWGEI